MTVFKNYFKILRSAYLTIAIFLGITVFFTVIMMAQPTMEEDFTISKPMITVINHDDSVFAQGLVDYLAKTTRFKDLTEDEIKDELFFAEIAAAVIIDQDLTEQMQENQEPKVTVIKAPSRITSMQVELLINQYLNLAKPYFQLGLSEQEIVEFLEKDLEKEVSLTYQTEEVEQATELQNTAFFFNFISFGLLAAIIGSVAFIMKNYNEKTIKMRSMCAPISNQQYQLQIIMGNVCLAFFLWLIFMGLGWFFYPNAMFTNSGLLMIANAFVFSQVALAIAYAIGVFVRSSEVQNGMATVIPLALAFLGGAFMPQSILGESVLKLSRITPTYWYVRANDRLSEQGLSELALSGFWQAILILLAFTLIIYGITFFLKQKYGKYIN